MTSWDIEGVMGEAGPITAPATALASALVVPVTSCTSKAIRWLDVLFGILAPEPGWINKRSSPSASPVRHLALLKRSYQWEQHRTTRGLNDCGQGCSELRKHLYLHSLMHSPLLASCIGSAEVLMLQL